MANEIVKMVAKKANISEPIAQIAVDTVLGMLKSKLPPAVGSTLDSFLGSGTAASSSKNDNPLGGLGDIAGALGGLFGGKK
ncbi:MAG: hypothetical protein FWD60_10810 [Candidatus Azobacteroides sp.]|nr:hypothetical protein [Candidatus Azobacteroides sp.]